MPRSTSIGSDNAAYRRGIVLGLTMAEIMLLLVFCLLIALAVLFSREKQRNDGLAAQLSQTKSLLDAERAQAKLLTAKAEGLDAEIKRLNALLNKLQVAGANPEEDWRELVEARRLIDTIRAGGADPQQVSKYAEQLKELVALLGSGAKGSDIAESWRQIQEAERQLKASGLSDVALNDTAGAIVEGAKAKRDLRQGLGQHDWPPIINLSEASGYSFAVGKADLAPAFQTKLQTSVIEQVADIVARYDVDIVEVIGHTDEQSVNNKVSNLDGRLAPALAGKVSVDSLTPADNAGLGMARAVSVASVLRSDPRLKNVTVLPLSAAQMILPGDKSSDGAVKGNVKERRRIEIRVRRSAGKVAAGSNSPISSQ